MSTAHLRTFVRWVVAALQGHYSRWAAPTRWSHRETSNGVDLVAPDGLTLVSSALLHGSFGQVTPRDFLMIGVDPVSASAAVGTVRGLQAVQERRPVRRLARPGATPVLQRRQGQAGRHHQARRHVPAHLADPGAKSAVMTAQGRRDRISTWVLALRERSGWQKGVVALANKNARILWVVMTRGAPFDADHLSTKPDAAAASAAAGMAPTVPAWHPIEPASLHDVTMKTR